MKISNIYRVLSGSFRFEVFRRKKGLYAQKHIYLLDIRNCLCRWYKFLAVEQHRKSVGKTGLFPVPLSTWNGKSLWCKMCWRFVRVYSIVTLLLFFKAAEMCKVCFLRIVSTSFVFLINLCLFWSGTVKKMIIILFL